MSKTTARIRAAVALVGLVALVLILWEPHLEGRNAHATVYQVYFNDPFLAFAYLGSIAFFVAVYQAFRLLGYPARGEAFPPEAARSMRTIRNCGIVLVGWVAIAEVIIFLQESDDRAGGVVIGLLIALGSVAVAATAAKLERKLQA